MTIPSAANVKISHLASDPEFTFHRWDPDDVNVVSEFLPVFYAAFGTPQVASTDIFLWKHRDNPAGKSIVYFACENVSNKVVAVRTFVPRVLICNGVSYPGYEACEASTHPNVARRGLFTMLMKRCLEDAELAGGYFLYGYPNFNSRPGYLKVGARDIGGIKLLLKPLNYLNLIGAILRGRKRLGRMTAVNVSEGSKSQVRDIPPDLGSLLQLREDWRDIWAGKRWVELLEHRLWRHPFHSYHLIDFGAGCAVLLPGMRGPLREMRIVDIYLRDIESAAVGNRLVKEIKRRFRMDCITAYMTTSHPHYSVLHSAGFLHAPSDGSFYTYTFKNCPPELAAKPWAISGLDYDTQ
ncbi:MAG: GNAT family N-acetyltransferase [Calditrichaeota bacterium]|nr:GNAT family N-acetyltransferase [Calditrichota bacterium]